MTTWSCHTHLVQSAVVLSAMLPKGSRDATWNAMVCLEKASSETPHLRRPNTSRPNNIPTRRAKNPAGARASPTGFKKYGSWPRPSLPQTLRGKQRGREGCVGQSRARNDAVAGAGAFGKTRVRFRVRFREFTRPRSGRKGGGTYSSGKVVMVAAYMPKYTCIALS